MLLLDPEAHPVVAHRGASGAFPENTLLAFTEGLRAGAEALEFDVRVTADRVPVVIHDATLDRTTNGTGAVALAPLDRLRELDAGRGERVPLLAEVLEAFPETPCIVEIKEAQAALPTRAVLERFDAASRVLVGSFQREALHPFRQPPWHRAATRGETALAWALSRMGASPIRRSYEAFTIPESYRRLHLADARFVRAARRSGALVHVWTVDDVQRASRLVALGVSGIITNWPDRMHASVR